MHARIWQYEYGSTSIYSDCCDMMCGMCMCVQKLAQVSNMVAQCSVRVHARVCRHPSSV